MRLVRGECRGRARGETAARSPRQCAPHSRERRAHRRCDRDDILGPRLAL